MRIWSKLSRILVIFAMAHIVTVTSANMKALIVDGQNNHAWQRTTPVLQNILESSGIFSVDVATAPEKGPMDNFKPDFSRYNVIVLNYNGMDWSKAARDDFVKYVENGGGVVSVHAADNSFPGWKEFNDMIGVGGWGGRDEKSGPMVRWRDGKMVLDNSPGQGGTHGPKHDFLVVVRDSNNPIMKGLPAKWLHASDELYSKMRGPAKNLTVLATAYADPKFDGTGENEPMLMTVTYGKGRIFHTVMGHDTYPMSSVDFIVTLQRGTEWAATGKVTQAAPADFPTSDKVSIRPFDELIGKIKTYQYGQSRLILSQIEDIVRNYAQSEDAAKHLEAKFAEVLASNATFDCKQFVCRQLSLIGTSASVAALASMAADPNTTDIALYALESIQDASVDDALIKMLPQVKSNVQKVGIINTLGNRKNQISTAAIVKFVTDPNEIVAQSAVASLGKICGGQAQTALNDAKTTAKSDKVRQAALEASLSCADELALKGNKQQAYKMYEALYEPNAVLSIRGAALRGMILTTTQDPGVLILETLKGSDVAMKSVAAMALNNVKTDNISEIAGVLPDAEPAVKVQLMAAFAQRGDLTVHDLIVAQAKSQDQNVRVAAVRALGVLGNEKDVLLLASLAAQYNDWESAITRESLSQIKSPGTNETIMNAVGSAEPKLKVELINSIMSRNISGATKILVSEAQGQNPQVRIESYKALRAVAGPAMLPELIELLLTSQPAEKAEAQRTVAAVSQKIADANARIQPVLSAYSAQTDINAKATLVAVLGKVGDMRALEVVRKAANDPDTTLKDAGIRALTEWPNTLASEDLLELANSTNMKYKVLALRGYVRLLTDRTVSDEQAVKGFEKAMALAPNNNEKKMVLSGLAQKRSLQALTMAERYLSDPALTQEAGAAVVAIAPDVIYWNYAQTKAALEKVLQTQANDDIKAAAKDILKNNKR